MGWGEGGITSAFCISCFLLGGPACQKKKEGREIEEKREGEKSI